MIRSLMEWLSRPATGWSDDRRTLVLSPHPDDEVLGCGGVIARRAVAGAVVWIVHLTDGAAGNGTVAQREEEACAAAATLGLGAERLVFLRFPDGQLAEYVDAAVARVQRLISDLGIQDLLCPYRRDYHPDHAAAWRIGRACLRPGVRIYEYPVWYGPWLLSRLRGRARLVALRQLIEVRRAVRVCVAEVLEVKRRALAAYRSQVAAFQAEGPWGLEFLAGFLRPYEVFFR